MSRHDNQEAPLSTAHERGIWARTTNAFMRARSALDRATDAAAARLASLPAFVCRHDCATFAFVATAIYFLPALVLGTNFIYHGDVLGWYLPALAKTHSLIHALDFTALDFSSFNGSSDFFLSPNFFGYHPLVVMMALLTPVKAAGPAGFGIFLVLLLALHTFIATYFSARLLTRFFGLDFGSAMLAAVVYVFSAAMLNAMYQPPFLICASIVPWAAYAALSHASLPSLRTLLLASLPVVVGFTAGYLPLGVACLALSAVLVAVRLLGWQPEGMLRDRIGALLVAARPFVLGLAVMILYLYSVYAFHKETTGSTVPSLFYSAHQLAELPQGILRIFTAHYAVPGPYYEFGVTWGLIPVAIGALFLLAPRAMLAMPAQDWQLAKAAAIIYFATVLAIFGQHSVVSDMVFFYVPQVGKMHIYQRFLLPAHLLFAVLVALMLRALVQARPLAASRVAVLLLGICTLASAYAVAWHSEAARAAGINNYIVFELGLALLFAIALTFPGRAFVFGTAAVLIALPAIDRMYDRSLPHATYEGQRKDRIAIDPELREGFVDWLRKRFPDRDIVKYVDVTPMWTSGVETFPKVFPFYAIREIPLSSYGGFTFYLSARADYMKRMPVQGDVRVQPDWDHVIDSGADFVVAGADELEAGYLGTLAAKRDPTDLYRLPNNVVALPLRAKGTTARSDDGRQYENGYFRVFPTGRGQGRARGENLARGKPARQSSTVGGGDASRAVDGNADGHFERGSVSHTAAEPDAWLEVDLGSVTTIDAVRISNRTDCCSHRLRDFWVFISAEPFRPDETATALEKRAGTWGRLHFTPNPSSVLETGGVQGRYLRVQFDGRKGGDERFLSIAELEAFRYEPMAGAAPRPAVPAGALTVHEFATDRAQWAKLEFESAVPATVQYLFWDNPRIRYYVDGKAAEPLSQGSLRAFELPAGRHTVEIRYRHWPLTLFWLVYGVYWAMLAAVFGAPLLSRGRRAIQRFRSRRAR